MTTHYSLRGIALTILLTVCTPAQAQISRVFVSVNGNDGNACSSLSTPCRTINGGVTQVDPNGEVIIIDTGSYAAGTVTKAVKINAAPGVVAFSGLPFSNINPGAGNTVVLRGLTLKSVTPGSGAGIQHSSGNLVIENCVIDGWLTGINAQSTGNLSISHTIFRNNINGTDGFGVNIQAGTVSLTDLHIANNSTGIRVLGGSVTVSTSVVVQNGTGFLRTAGTFTSMGNNVVEGNTLNTSGTITMGMLK